MKSSPAPRRRGLHGLWQALVLVAVVAAIFLYIICFSIVHAADLQELHKAGAIVVFGAAEYSGRPSPVYRARLDHAFDLFQKGLAPIVITTGGAGEDPTYSEGGVGHDYLMRRGIPEPNLIAETQGADTAQSAQRVAVILKRNGMRNCVAVSDAYHVFRIQKLLEHEGIQVYVAPRPDSRPHSAWQRMLAVLREAVSYTAWKLQTVF
ncbi:MAG TPA: YdcF family protein [Terriglobales bacterium]|nr:YdcF family protein [Terriglobales bacterium]